MLSEGLLRLPSQKRHRRRSTGSPARNAVRMRPIYGQAQVGRRGHAAAARSRPMPPCPHEGGHETAFRSEAARWTLAALDRARPTSNLRPMRFPPAGGTASFSATTRSDAPGPTASCLTRGGAHLGAWAFLKHDPFGCTDDVFVHHVGGSVVVTPGRPQTGMTALNAGHAPGPAWQVLGSPPT